ncbi:protein-methionine-sulfoxide reductase catalytic subunit MsrP [Candidatus Methylopumilus universalis]|jgi:methionine sulfoxide reductase catalytic subunit|uniref:Protein-methionine-sulfoxide reductase catalytic subunit MsrP n=1 Tax=Candidatus Methylopumilus universalis TaxID=2588536 RepID=A0AAX1EYR1_9PROT|nr:protein-methionine-sulfoxide reductase catalytic subunit MsrP [Candidatus Methylopumilus universalis]QDC40953.1 protein-methionine-sulfoxide reductase catalytic subunit MsrP [Candidatus Methylopumilus universalis]QDC42244.1 protein-methionine-sulfoxide reductase catalytic subunit MsrP [Candidatus Methylopumilus universalis]QDC54630.1 protein-methionine-sulfoxide reductase catalytic subunit MsrP [Candidatus Methylopumilus universalis]QDC55910.1 protein-methionine-sulfoxide reductase catalytic
MTTFKKIPSSEITPEHIYNDRRNFIKNLGLILSSTALSTFTNTGFAALNTLPSFIQSKDHGNEKLTSFKDITSYNNYYEFGTSKSDPQDHAHLLKIDPWSISIEGSVAKPLKLDIDELIKLIPIEERIYRLRCVEGWSMVIPWIGIPLNSLLKKVTPTGNAKYVEFVSLKRPSEMIGQKDDMLDWPYTEGLRLDEAMHPLTILAVGLYGKVLPKQNGAPIRLVVPWKYGFKSVKAITKIRLVEKMPISTWMKANPKEYGFYSNVNPEVDHPRWTQATERRIGESLLSPRLKTQMFNGYKEEVAHLYQGMDLNKNF